MTYTVPSEAASSPQLFPIDGPRTPAIGASLPGAYAASETRLSCTSNGEKSPQFGPALPDEMRSDPLRTVLVPWPRASLARSDLAAPRWLAGCSSGKTPASASSAQMPSESPASGEEAKMRTIVVLRSAHSARGT